jgi:xanthosine utilization system XapX-like protein
MEVKRWRIVNYIALIGIVAVMLHDSVIKWEQQLLAKGRVPQGCES